MTIRITCINKSGGHHEDPHEAIQTLGWVNEQSASETGKNTRLEMYDWVKKGGQAFVVVGTSRAQLITAETRMGTKYVKTKPDATTKDNLLKLSECR